MEILSKDINEENIEYIELLYNEYKWLMYSSIQKYVNNPEVIEDLLHDSIIKLIPKAPMLRNMEKPAMITYVVYTVRNTTFNYLKHAKLEINNLTLEMDALSESLRANETDDRSLETQIIIDQQAEEFRRVLIQLPAKEQEILIRKYYLDESNCEIAKQLNCKSNSVRMMLTRARRDLLQLLRKEKHFYENK